MRGASTVSPPSRESTMNIDGKVIVITGAARGIGQEYARYLGGLGARIVAADINDCSSTLELVKAESGTAVGAKLDVASAASAMDMARTALDAFGRIDALINNAALYGGLKGGRFDTISEPDWDAAMAVNVKGIWNCCKAVVPAIRRAGGGSIVNIASLAATYGMPYGLHYTTSKAAVIGLTRGLARELGRDNIRVNAVAPSGGLDRGHARVLCRQNRQGARHHQDEPGDRPKPGVHRPGGHRALAGVGRQPPGHGPDHRSRRRNRHALSGCGVRAPPAWRASY